MEQLWESGKECGGMATKAFMWLGVSECSTWNIARHHGKAAEVAIGSGYLFRQETTEIQDNGIFCSLKPCDLLSEQSACRQPHQARMFHVEHSALGSVELYSVREAGENQAVLADSRSFDCASRGEAARGSAQDGNFRDGGLRVDQTFVRNLITRPLRRACLELFEGDGEVVGAFDLLLCGFACKGRVRERHEVAT